MSVYTAILNISDAKGKDKVEVIRSLSDEVTASLKTVVTMTYDQLKAYHITKVMDWEPSGGLFGAKYGVVNTLETAINFLNILNNNGSAGASDKVALAEMAFYMSEEDRVILNLILRRDLQCGASLSTFRKVWGKKFCPDFPKPLCSSYDEAKILKHIKFPAYSQLKSDGARAMTVVDGTVELFTRNGKNYKGLRSLELEIASLNLRGKVFDGELVVLDIDGNILERKVGNGILNKSINGDISKEEADRVRYIVWDIVDKKEFFSDIKAVQTYNDRFEYLTELTDGSTRLILTESRVVNNLPEAKKHYHELLMKGEEGTILKNIKALFKDARTTDQFKFKEIHPAELLITATYPGKKGSKYENCIGGFTVQTMCGTVISNVGSGLTDAERKLDPIEYIGRIGMFKYNERVTSEGRTTESLFLPIFEEMRFDKDTANTRDELIAQEESSRALDVGDI